MIRDFINSTEIDLLLVPSPKTPAPFFSTSTYTFCPSHLNISNEEKNREKHAIKLNTKSFYDTKHYELKKNILKMNY